MIKLPINHTTIFLVFLRKHKPQKRDFCFHFRFFQVSVSNIQRLFTKILYIISNSHFLYRSDGYCEFVPMFLKHNQHETQRCDSSPDLTLPFLCSVWKFFICTDRLTDDSNLKNKIFSLLTSSCTLSGFDYHPLLRLIKVFTEMYQKVVLKLY